MSWIRYHFKTYAVKDKRPLIFNPEYPCWCSGYGKYSGFLGVTEEQYSVIIVFLPKDANLKDYWDDAFDVTYTEEPDITFSERFPKPDYFVE